MTVRATEIGYHDEAWRCGDAEDSLAESDRESDSGGSSNEATGETEKCGFGQKKIEDAARGATMAFIMPSRACARRRCWSCAMTQRV